MSITELIIEIRMTKAKACQATGTEAINLSIAVIALQDSLIRALIQLSVPDRDAALKTHSIV